MIICSGETAMRKTLFFLVFPIFLFGTDAREIYRTVDRYIKKDFPESFTCKIKGKSLTESIRKIPEDAVQDPDRVFIQLLFHRKWGTRVLLRGVSGPFQDRFSYIERVFEFIQPFLQDLSFKQFSRKYTIFDTGESGFKLKKKFTEGAYLQIGIGKGRIQQVREYKNDDLQMRMEIHYRSFEKYTLPVRLKVFFYEREKLKILNFRLNDFDFKPNLSEEDFLG
jgi:hypothetical protein